MFDEGRDKAVRMFVIHLDSSKMMKTDCKNKSVSVSVASNVIREIVGVDENLSIEISYLTTPPSSTPQQSLLEFKHELYYEPT